MINRFSQFLVEEEKTAFFTMGRFNPPTMGHGMLLDKVSKAAGKNPYKSICITVKRCKEKSIRI